MTITIALFVAVLASAQTTPQAPATPATTPPPTTVSPAAPTSRTPEPLICRTQAVVGSNRRQRVCMTVAERDERRQSGASVRERLERNTDAGAIGNGQGGTGSPGRGF
jgi:hypothetical protein